MADYTLINIQYNSGAGTDASPVWTGTAIAFAGSSGANEFRFCDSASSPAATTTTTSAAWPYSTRPAATAAINQLWAFVSDAVGLQVSTYDGTRAKANVLRFNLDNTGNFVSAPRVTAFADNTHPTPSAGTQASNPTNGANIINGQVTDTSSTSYLKGNVYGSGLTAAGVQETPAAGAVGTTMLVTSGSAGSLATSAAAWLTTYQSLQGFTQYITLGAIPKSVTAGFIYFVVVLFVGPNMLPGIMPFVPMCLDYTFA